MTVNTFPVRPRTLAQMIEASPLRQGRDAIVARLRELCQGVSVVGHPGKIDILDVVERDIVKAPGIAVGWSRVRAPREIDGAIAMAVDWTAYIVAEDLADLAARKSVPRDSVAYGIGTALLEILANDEAATWGLPRITAPAQAELKPVFTAEAYEKGSVFYAVTWTQAFVDRGRGWFEGPTPQTGQDAESAWADFGEEGVPAGLLGLIARGGEDEGGDA